jgi:hypothetical protein
MPKTSTRVSFGLFDLALKGDSSLACTSLQPFSKLADLKSGNASNRPYASYEPNFWLLDGQYKFLPEDATAVHVGLMSLAMSDASGDFAVAPVLTVTFGEVHSTESLSLVFATYSGDYCSALTIAYYNASNVLIRADAYTPTGVEFTTGQAVANFKRIAITFTKTSRPYRYLRVSALDYGELISFEGTAIKAASLIEEVDQLSAELRYNVLDLSLYSADAQFSIINPTGDYASLAERQPLDVYETVDGVSQYVGRYYLDDWQNLSDTNYQFTATDILGVLDAVPYRGGMWLGAGIAIQDLIEAVLGPVSVPYELDSELMGTMVRGWLPSGSYRQALQQIGFAVGASITGSRSGVIRIFKARIAANESAGQTITKAQKGQEQALSLKPLVTGVEVTAHNYSIGGESQVVMNGQYEAGLHEVTFSEPMYALSVDGATIIESGVNYAVLLVVAAGTVTLTGLKYIDTTAVTSIHAPSLPAGVRPNVLRIEKATLVHAGNVSAVAQRVYNYYQQRYLQKVKLYAPSVEPGSVVVVDTLYSKQLRAVVEKMETDLALGFTSQVELTGVAHELD